VTISFQHGALCRAWPRKLWNKPSMLVRVLNRVTLLVSDPRRYLESISLRAISRGCSSAKTLTPRAAEIGMRVR
jgi:hypothetical protein